MFLQNATSFGLITMPSKETLLRKVNQQHLIKIKIITSAGLHFQNLVKKLNIDLKIRDGDDHAFYGQFNKTDTIKHALAAYDGAEAVGSGAIREHAPGTMEVKRMFVSPHQRGKGIALKMLGELENWCRELD